MPSPEVVESHGTERDEVMIPQGASYQINAVAKYLFVINTPCMLIKLSIKWGANNNLLLAPILNGYNQAIKNPLARALKSLVPELHKILY